jgi:iron complex outermembrane recepter protein
MCRNSPWILGVGIAVSALAGPALAQQAENSGNVLDEIVVTAQKRAEKLQDVPIPITVVNAEQLEQQQIYSIEDLARTTPSLEMIQAFGGPGGGGQIRGISTVSFTATAEAAVGIVVDGLPQGNVNTNDIFDVERVEVLRGPQGTLFGLTTSAGVINMTTQAPKIGEFEGNLHLDYSNDGTVGSEYGRSTLRGVINIPINEAQALRISASGDRTKAVQFNTLRDEDSDLKGSSVRARYLLKPSDRFEMNLIVDYGQRDSNYAAPSFNYVEADAGLTSRLATCGITPSYENQSRCGNHVEQDSSNNFGFSAQLDFGLGDMTLTSISGYRETETGPLDNDIQGQRTESTQLFAINQTGDARQFTQELRLLSAGDRRVEYLAGLFYSDYVGNTDNGGSIPGGGFNVEISLPFPPFVIRPVPPSWTKSHTINQSTAAFGQATFHATDALSLIAGLRFTHQTIETGSTGNLLTPVPVPSFGDVSEDDTSGRLGLQYKFGPDLTSYATITRGYKGPQVTPAAQGVPETILAAEKPTAYEIGLKGALVDGRLGVDANVFYTKVENFQGQRCRITSTGVLNCPPESIPSITTRGFELGLFGSPLPGLTINGGYIYDIAEYPGGYTGYDPNNLNGGTTDLSNEQLVNVPKDKFTLTADYTHSVGGLNGFVSMDTVYKSDIRFGPTADERFIYPSHWTVGARLGVRSQTGTWSVALFARNLTNEHEPITLFGGPAFTSPSPFAPPGSAAANGFVNGISQIYAASELRQVGLTVDVHF